MIIEKGSRHGHTHYLFKRTAEEICAAAYEELARDNGFYKDWPDQQTFVFYHWPQFLQLARQHLVEALSSKHLPDAAKEEIFDAILKDRTLQQRVAPGSTPLMY